MLWIFSLIILTILTIIVSALAIPVTIAFQVRRDEKVTGHVAISWLFGLIRLFPSWTEKKQTALTELSTEPAEPSWKDDPVSKIRSLWEIVRVKGLQDCFMRLIKRLAGSIRLQFLIIEGRFGLQNPAETGRIWGLYCALSGLLILLHRVTIRLQPDFERPALAFDGRGSIRITPLRALFVVLMFVLSPPVLRAGWTAARGR